LEKGEKEEEEGEAHPLLSFWEELLGEKRERDAERSNGIAHLKKKKRGGKVNSALGRHNSEGEGRQPSCRRKLEKKTARHNRGGRKRRRDDRAKL